MFKKVAIEALKAGVAIGAGALMTAIARPAIRKFFNLDKEQKPETIPSEDIEDYEVTEEEE